MSIRIDPDSSTAQTAGLNILSLGTLYEGIMSVIYAPAKLNADGGGIGGLSALDILHEILSRMDTKGSPKKPCEVFDLICGSSTGGYALSRLMFLNLWPCKTNCLGRLIAIMLGRLKMSVCECISAFTKVLSEVLPRRSRLPVDMRGRLKPRFETEILDNAIHNVLQDCHFDKDALLSEESPRSTPVTYGLLDSLPPHVLIY